MRKQTEAEGKAALSKEARKYCPAALACLQEIMSDPKVAPELRRTAAYMYILTRFRPHAPH